MDTPTLRGLWLAAVDAPLAPAVRLVTCAGLALLGLCVALAAAAWMRFLRPAAGPISARPRGADVSFLAWCVGRLGLGTLALAAGARAVARALDPGADGAAALWYVLVAVALVGGGALGRSGRPSSRWRRSPGPPSPPTCAGSRRCSCSGTGRRPAR
jgi:hypothetical protein